MQKRPEWGLCLALFMAPMATLSEVITLANGDRYEGEISDGVLNGPGVYQWAGGDRYEGEFRNALPHGQGTYTWPDGRRYQGEFALGRREGEGTLSWPNGDVYQGGFISNQRSGVGFMRWHSGETYRGQFVEGTMQGDGNYSWPNGDRYVGGFSADQRSGKGILLQADGSYWSGQFLNGEPNGWGIQGQASGGLILQKRESGRLLEQFSVAINPQCQDENEPQLWMIHADGCINGLAHGDGTAVTRNGDRMISDGRWILGRKFSGTIEQLPIPPELQRQSVLSQGEG